MYLDMQMVVEVICALAVPDSSRSGAARLGNLPEKPESLAALGL